MDLEYFIGALVVRRGQSGARAALVQEDSNRCFFFTSPQKAEFY